MSGRKRQPLSISEKIKILKVVRESGNKKKVEIAKELGIPASTLNSIISKGKEIEDKARVFGVSSSKRMRIQGGKYENLEDALLQWFQQHRAEGIPISGPLLCEKATEIGLRLGLENFQASSGWLHKFKLRHGICCKSMCGESGNVDADVVSAWKSGPLQELVEQYAPKDIFNADETGLFYSLMPEKTMAFKGENCHGGKKSKDRVTVLLCANSDGTEKLPPVTIGKFAKPRCFKHIKTLPTKYEHNKNSWMTTKIFEDWLRALDARMGIRGRKILLFVDKCPAHPPDTSYLRNIKVQFFPSNCTSELQPMDLGVIRNLKLHYRKMLVQQAIRYIDNGNRSSTKINVLQAMHFISSSWQKVEESTIRNCFRKAGFGSPEDDVEMELALGDLPINQADFTEFVDVDKDVVTSELRSIEDIVSEINEEIDEDSDDEVDDSEINVVGFSEAVAALETVKKFVMQHSVADEVMGQLSRLEGEVYTLGAYNVKQTKITDFFHK